MSQTLLRTRDDVHAYVRELSARHAEDDRLVKAWQVARRMTWIVLLAGSFMLYYLTFAINETLSLPQLWVSAPVSAASSKLPLRSFR